MQQTPESFLILRSARVSLSGDKESVTVSDPLTDLRLYRPNPIPCLGALEFKRDQILLNRIGLNPGNG